MLKIRIGITVLCLVLCLGAVAEAQVSIGVGTPNVSIGINLPLFPQLVRIPGYPVYYAPQVAANYFFYDGMYWVFSNDNWYASTWYNGPWGLVAPEVVPYYILRVPVRYYRHPPPYFHGWRANAPPRWGDHWGPNWAQRRSGWNHWNRKIVPRPAPLPSYQRNYPAKRYPRVRQQPKLRSQHYHYQPRSQASRQHYQHHRASPPVRKGVKGRR
ncbi:MAG TPA: hypothetical protein PLI53_08875 [Geobacteraceae bacterium]|nr:hypothetical protein [Geobacteraceae bacterium]